jgi:hypothetical protein
MHALPSNSRHRAFKQQAFNNYTLLQIAYPYGMNNLNKNLQQSVD